MTKNRYRRVEVRLNDEELEQLNLAVAKTGLSREEYLRSIINNRVPAEKPHPDFIETIRQLRKIGNNLNQIVVIAYKTGSIDVLKYKKEAEKLQNEIQQILQTYREYRKEDQ